MLYALFSRLQEKQKRYKYSAKVIYVSTIVMAKEKHEINLAGLKNHSL